ncbi:MAG: nucleotide sugar dehydrogenase [Thermoprotei archaeon]|nr:nucleotide sugar dehydrogenase [Thermoprotei archaeon]
MIRMVNLLELSENEIKAKLRKGEVRVAVFGLGHVGLPLACAWLKAGAYVIGVAKTERKVSLINEGINPLKDEPTLTPIVEKYVREGKFKATTDGVGAAKEADVIIIATPTSVKWNEPGKPLDLSILREVLETVGKGLSRGNIVIIEPTVPPGTTLNIAKPLLERISGLKVEEDFGLAYSPERIMTGHAFQDIVENYPKIIGGVGPKSSKVAKALYEVVAKKGVIVLSSPTAAELEKVAEGIYRDVNIALANELAKLSHILGIDFDEVRYAANSQPYCHLHKPGVGVGGYCIPIYPYFALHTASRFNLELQLTRLGRIINEHMPEYVANLALEALAKLNIRADKAKVAILGLAFRGNIGDTRLTPTLDLIRFLESYGITDIIIHDPHVENNPTKYPLVKNLEEAVKGRHVVIVATDHNEYKGLKPSKILQLSKLKRIAIVDGRHAIDFRENVGGRVVYVGVGRPWTIL